MPVYTVKSGELDVVIKNRKTVKTAAKSAIRDADANLELGVFISISEFGKEKDTEYILTIPLLHEMGSTFEFIKDKGSLSVHRNKKGRAANKPEMVESLRCDI